MAMRRSLVLTNEAARHPFRQSQPRFDKAPVLRLPAKKDQTDLAFFGTCFSAFFVLIMGMII